jgi:D-sedoheptulose 7-phosphate isomerase
MKELLKRIKKARFVFVCGNGGSAATAEHMTNDLFSKGIKAICLNSNTSIMTMIANDFGYKYVFSKQLDLFASPGDLLIVISASGNSKNILEALKSRKWNGYYYDPMFDETYYTFALLGMGGGKAKKLADFNITINSDDYGVIEDKHLQICHKIKQAL